MQFLPRTTAVTLTVEDLLDEVARGNVRVPRFQRGLKWKAEDDRRLLDSVNRGFPVGSLLFWQRPAEAARLEFAGLVIDAPAAATVRFVVDGQQRIHALACALLPGASTERTLMLDLETNEIMTRGGQQVVPLNVLGNGVRLLAWLSTSGFTESLQRLAFAASRRLLEYKLPAYVIDTPDEQLVIEVFERLNSTGKKLTRAEVFQALDTGNQVEPSLRGLEARISPLGFGAIPVSVLQQTVAAVAGADITEDFRPKWSSEEREDIYRRTEKGLAAAIQFLRQQADIPHVKLLPYSLQLTTLAAYFARFSSAPARAQTLLRHWVWRVGLDGSAKGSFPEARRFMRALAQSNNADEAARTVLATATRPATLPALSTTFSLTKARSRLEAVLLTRAALLQHPEWREPLEKLLLTPAKAFRVWRAEARGPLAKSLANRVLQILPGRTPDEVTDFVVPEAHFEEPSPAVARRQLRLQDAWEALVRNHVGLDDSDRPSLQSLLIEDEAANG